MSGPRYSTIPAGAITDDRLDGRYDLKVLGLLGTHIDNLGWCFRSQATMAEQLGCGRATVQRALDRLEAAGWIARRAEMRRDGSTTANSYRVILDVAEAGDESGEPLGRLTGEAGPPAQETGGARPLKTRAGIGTTPVLTKTRESAGEGAETRAEAERAADADRADVAARLEAFRPIWPTTRSDDADAVASAMAALSPEDREEAVRAAPIFLAALAADRRKLTISGATYLGRRRWKPALEAAKAEKSGKGGASLTGGKIFADTWSKRFWACVVRAGLDGASKFEMRKRANLVLTLPTIGWPINGPDDLATIDALAETLVSTPSTSARAERWSLWLADRGFDIRERIVGCKAFWVFLPDHDPPLGAAGDDDDLVA